MRFDTRFGTVFLLLFTIVGAASSHAATWTEQSGDAGPLPINAQPTVGNGALTQIQGAFLSDFDIDMYCIRIDNRAAFFANLACLSFSNPDLWLFDASGNGIQLNDACQFGQTNLTAALTPSNGLYYLAVSTSDQDAVNNLNQPIWNSPSVSGARAPDGPGAPGPISSWAGVPFHQGSNSYTINLGGTTFCEIALPVAPATWGAVKARFVEP
ncbi:MAG: hypothetical protein SGI90_17280 [Candidatus Eisenbacteria bacterium]|nr:hypothetical protein [Candidatus Eisenbacteria bacterium]